MDQISDLIDPGDRIKTTTRLSSLLLDESSWSKIKECAKLRRTKGTNKNNQSSRSHFFVLFSFNCEKKSQSCDWRSSYAKQADDDEDYGDCGGKNLKKLPDFENKPKIRTQNLAKK